VLVLEIVEVISPVLETDIDPVIVGVADTVFDILIDPVIVGVPVELLDNIADLVGVIVEIVEDDFLALYDKLGLPETLLLKVCVGDGLPAPLFVFVIVVVIVSVLLNIDVTLAELVTDEVLVIKDVLEDVGDPVIV